MPLRKRVVASQGADGSLPTLLVYKNKDMAHLLAVVHESYREPLLYIDEDMSEALGLEDGSGFRLWVSGAQGMLSAIYDE